MTHCLHGKHHAVFGAPVPDRLCRARRRTRDRSRALADTAIGLPFVARGQPIGRAEPQRAEASPGPGS